MNNIITLTGICPLLAISIHTITPTVSIDSYSEETHNEEVQNKTLFTYPEITAFSDLSTITSASLQYDEEIDIVLAFAESIISDCKELDGEFSKLIDDNFWDLV